MAEILDYDPNTGTVTKFDFDPETGLCSVWDEQFVDPLFEHVKMMHDFAPTSYINKDAQGVLAMSIPTTLYYDLKQQGQLDTHADIKRMINNSEYAKFKICNGTV